MITKVFNESDYEGCSILKLSVTKEAFDITGTFEKPFELRNHSEWIESRLVEKHLFGMRKQPVSIVYKHYDYVLLTNGYGALRPWKLFEFKKVSPVLHPIHWMFSNGLTFYQKSGDYIIRLGRTIDSGNIA